MPVAPEVPALPIAYVRALQLMRQPDADADELARVANDDPAFTAALIRLANSAESSPLSRVRTARGAIVRLGVPEARRTIIGVTLTQAFRGASGSHIDERELWQHLVAVGVLADRLAWGEVHYGDAFTAGLVHDIGRLAMAAEDPRSYGQVVLLARGGTETARAEHRFFGLTHVEWGTALARKWGFPDDVVEAIADHHDGSSGGLAWVVARAREQAWTFGIGDGVIPGGGPRPEAGVAGQPEEAATLLKDVNRYVNSIRRAA